MADEGYKGQVSAKAGADMVNFRWDDAEEAALHLQSLRESEDETLQAIAAVIDEAMTDRKPKKKRPAKKTSKKSRRDEDDDEDEDEEDEDEDEDEDEEEERPKKKRSSRSTKSKPKSKSRGKSRR